MLLATALLYAQIAVAQEPGRWSTARLPGTAKFLAGEVGWKSSRLDRVRLVRDIASALHASPTHGLADLDRLRTLVDAFEGLEVLLAKATLDGKVVADVTNRNARRNLDSLLDLLGYELQVSGGKTSVRVRRAELAVVQRELFTRAGLRLDEFVERVVRGESAPLEVPYFEVPLPLTPAFWTTSILESDVPPASLMGRILLNREGALAYVGLHALDPDTAASLTAHPKLLKKLSSAYVSPFAAFARSIHVVDGRVKTPGGETADEIWRDIVGADPKNTAAFIEALMSGDGGRLAWFYDLVGQSPRPLQAFILANWETDQPRRQRRVRRLYDFFRSSAALSWNLDGRPFDRPDQDPALAILGWQVDASGRPLGPTSRRFWSTAIGSENVEGTVNVALKAADDDDMIDAGTLAEMASSDRTRSGRPQALALAQSVAIRDMAATPMAIATVVRAGLRYPALVRTLERMPLRNAATIAAAIRRANTLANVADNTGTYVNLTQFQSLLAILDHAASMNDDATDLDGLIMSLCAVPLGRSGLYDGALVAWFRDRIVGLAKERADLPATPADSGVDERALRAWLAGLTHSRLTANLEWEGWKYRADPATVRYRDLSRIRDRQLQTTVDVLEGFAATVASLRTLTGVPQARQAAVDLKQFAASVATVPADAPPGIDSFAIGRFIADAIRRLDGITTDADLKRAVPVADDLSIAVDRVAASAFRALAYAPHLGNPDGPLLLAGDVSPRHDFGFTERIEARKGRVAWLLPEIVSSSTEKWHIKGSVLGLDFALASLALRDSVDGAPPEAGAFDPEDRLGLMRSALAFPVSAGWTAEALAAVAGTLAKGRLAVPERPASGDGRWEWRYHATAWARTHEPEALPSLFSMADYLSFGSGVEEWDQHSRFGGELMSLTGSRRPQLPPRMIWEAALGHAGTGLLAAWTPDLRLRVAEIMHELALPGILAPAVSARAATAVFGQVAPGDSSDWAVVLRRIADITRDDVSDIVAALTADGTLVTVEQ